MARVAGTECAVPQPGYPVAPATGCVLVIMTTTLSRVSVHPVALCSVASRHGTTSDPETGTVT